MTGIDLLGFVAGTLTTCAFWPQLQKTWASKSSGDVSPGMLGASPTLAVYCGERSATICVVLGQKKSSMYSSEYTSGFPGPTASQLAASPSPRHEGNVGQAPSHIPSRRLPLVSVWTGSGFLADHSGRFHHVASGGSDPIAQAALSRLAGC